MNKKTVFAGLLASVLLLSSCQSMGQFYGTATGASIGGIFGSAIGGMADGPRGHDLGTVVGMAVGGIIGAAATAPKTDDGNYRSSDYYYDYGVDDYRQNNSYSPFVNIEIEELRFVDENNNRALDANEHAKLVFIMRNTCRPPLALRNLGQARPCVTRARCSPPRNSRMGRPIFPSAYRMVINSTPCAPSNCALPVSFSDNIDNLINNLDNNLKSCLGCFSI